MFVILGIGHGWAPTVIDSRPEQNFIREAQKGLNDIRSYWIGGSTDIKKGDIFTSSGYSTTESGDCYLYLMVDYFLQRRIFSLF